MPFSSRLTKDLARLLTAAALALALGACGGDDTVSEDGQLSETTEATAATVEIERSRYEPREVSIVRGATVEFVNLDPFAHTVTSADGSPLRYDSGSFGEGEVFRQTFAEAGTYDYFCEIHPTMRATVTVG